MLSILYSTYLFTVPFFKKDRITNDDLNIVKSLNDEKINDNNFIIYFMSFIILANWASYRKIITI